MRVFEKGSLGAADPDRGRFRSFLLASLQHYVSHERDHAQAEKRGGSTVLLPLELEGAEGRYRREPPDDRTPEAVFDQRWALSVLDRVAATLREEFRRRGKEAVFDGLREHLIGDDDRLSYREIGARLGLSEVAARVAVTGCADGSASCCVGRSVRPSPRLRTSKARFRSDPRRGSLTRRPCPPPGTCNESSVCPLVMPESRTPSRRDRDTDLAHGRNRPLRLDAEPRFRVGWRRAAFVRRAC